MKRLLQKNGLRRCLLAAVLLCGLGGDAGAQVKGAEYYFDTDPGFGQGAAVPFYYAAQDTTYTFSAGIANLSNGLHKLYVRSYDTARRTWSQSIPKLFYKQAVLGSPLVNVTGAEYFFDTDPGVGTATSVSITAGQDISISFSASVASLSNGIHRLYVRTKDANGLWSMAAPQLFYKDAAASNPLVNVNKAECFFDADPGFGLGTDVPLTAGQDITFSFTGSIASLGNGVHRLYVRTRDAAGRWSFSAPQFFYKSPAPLSTIANITKAEYFFDNDPGYGAGTSVSILAGQDVTFNFNGGIAALSNGIHRISVRTQDVTGLWSMTTTQLFYKDATVSAPLANIVKLEYFFDADPGFGGGTTVSVMPAQDVVTFNFSGTIASLSNGLHRLYVRSQDANGKWSMSAPQLFFKEAAASNPLANISKTEYFFDTDPGFGNGTDIPVTAGQDITFGFNPTVAQLTYSAFHRLYIRSRDANGKWSMTTSQLFYLPPGIPPAPVKVTKLEYYIDTDPGFGVATNVPFTKGLDVTINFNASISSLSSGIHYLGMRSQDSIGRWSLTATQMFYREPAVSNPLANITKAEYFIDNDPGIGVATNAPVVAGQDITFSFSSSLAGLSNGIHRLYVRTKDAIGKWSITAPQLFYYEPSVSAPLANITKAEYFFDTDPGFGLATNVPVTAGQDIGIPFTAAIASLSNGVHRLVVRTRDANGKWSMGTPQLFFKEPVQSHTPGYLTKLEWFWDTDPGFGSANAVSVPANTIDLQNHSFTASVPVGFTGTHLFYIRAKDDWGMTAVKQVNFIGVALPTTLLEFRARREDARVRLDWEVANEQGRAQYIVERSADGKRFDSIGTRKAVALKDYFLYDEQPLRGMNYYRLRQVTTSGGYKYSPVVTVMFSGGTIDVQVYPNPASWRFNISAGKALGSVSLTDMSGRIVRSYDDVSGDYTLDGVAAGVYIVEVTGADGAVALKPLVVR